MVRELIDIHSHVLPQIDDGSTSMEMTHAMLGEAKAAGVEMLVASPHFRGEINRARIQQAYSETQNAAYGYGIQMRLGFEVHYSMLAHLDIQAIADWCVQGTNFLLLEFSNTTKPVNWDVMVCNLIRGGYQPIIVHPERYEYIQNDTDMAMELKRYGCELQVDALSIKDRFALGNPQAKTAKKLLHMGIADYLASDAHRPEHYREFGKILKRLEKCWPESGSLQKNVFL